MTDIERSLHAIDQIHYVRVEAHDHISKARAALGRPDLSPEERAIEAIAHLEGLAALILVRAGALKNLYNLSTL